MLQAPKGTSNEHGHCDSDLSADGQQCDGRSNLFPGVPWWDALKPSLGGGFGDDDAGGGQ